MTIIHFFTFHLDLGVKVTQNVAQNPLQYVTYAPAKFEVATSNSLRDAFTKKKIFDLDLHKLLPHV